MRARIDEELACRIGLPRYERMLEIASAARASFASLVGAEPERIALTHSTTGAVNLFLGGLDLQPGDEVVTTDAEHPGLDEPVARLERHGAVVRRAVLLEGADPLTAVTELIGPHTRVVALSHVLWGTGQILPVAEIAAAARAAGALCLIDGAQSGGAIPVDVAEVGADGYTISGQKWLCGPNATGALHLREGLEDVLDPPQPSWLTRDLHADGHPLWPGARRFDGATLGIGELAGLTAALEWRGRAVGWEAGFAAAARGAEALRERLAEVPGVEVQRPPGPLATLVTWTLAGRDPEEVNDALDARGVLVRACPAPRVLRASVGFWTSDDDLDRLVEGVAALAQ
jgi:L-cysteine/cystine lyase